MSIVEQPVPQVPAGHLLVRTRCSLISAGTERMLFEFGRSSLIQKALSQPEKVREVVQKARVLGIGPTWQAVQTKMDEPLPLGYCNAGIVVDRAPDVVEFAIGTRVSSNGGHAEFVAVPKTLCARIPDAVSDEEACFAPLAAIGLQGVRLLTPTLGERVGVIGLGLVGLLAAQLLKISGCHVIGFDFNHQRLRLADTFGIDTVDLESTSDPVARGVQFSGGAALDGVIIAASATNATPITQAADMCRQRGRIVLIGVCSLELNRQQFYKKELTFQVSCSYGPGRYDVQYESYARDYPQGFVRWTAQRNFAAVLEAMAARALNVSPLITDRVSQEDVTTAYDRLNQSDSLGIVLQYAGEAAPTQRVDLPSVRRARPAPSSTIRVGLIGSGAFARSTILPILRQSDVELRGVASRTGVSAAHVAGKFGFKYCTSAVDDVLGDSDTNVVFITTRHDTHAALVRKALTAGKHVFVEKPLCIDEEQLADIENAYRQIAVTDHLQLMMGLNRRFSRLSQKLSSLLASMCSPKAMVFTVNAGVVAAGHWINDPAVSGGRIVGEVCHFIDLLAFLARSPAVAVQAVTEKDQMTLTLRHQDESIGTVHYFSSGHPSFPKETLSVFADKRVYVLDNFRALRAWGDRRFKSLRLWSQDKGHRQEVDVFLQAVRDGQAAPIPFESLVNVTRASFAAVRAAQSGRVEPCA